MSDPRVGVVMITRDRCAEAARSLECLGSLPERPRLVVVDNGSSDGTPDELERRFPDVQLIRLAENKGAAARTIGVRMLSTPYVAFSDDDSWWRPGALWRAAQLLDRHPRVGVVAARVLVGPEERPDPVCHAMAASPLDGDGDLPGVRVLGFVACGSVVRRDAYLAAGGFQEGFGVGGEEQLLATDLAAAGHPVVYVPDVVAHHHPSPTRDPRARAAGMVRNDLWFEWMRRSLPRALASTARVAAAATRRQDARSGLSQALRGLPRALRQRRTAPPRVERDLDSVERSVARQGTG